MVCETVSGNVKVNVNVKEEAWAEMLGFVCVKWIDQVLVLLFVVPASRE